jgi:ABC-type transport system involved in multi-copper enzyme maturation permease subunit
VIRGLRPGWAQYLWGESVATVMPWMQMRNVEFSRGPVPALVSLLVYTALLVGLATVLFRRRDVAGA